MAKKMDLRVKRTQKMIVEAFMKLVAEKGYDAVSVQDIADEAMINRATFYAHFKDKQDLYDSIFDFAINKIGIFFDPELLVRGNKIQVKRIETVLTQIYEAVYSQKDFYIVLLTGSSSETFRKKVAKLMYERYIDIFKRLKITENEMEIPIDFIIDYMTSIYMSTLFWWITHDSEMTANQLAKLVIKLIGNGHLTVRGIEIEK